MVANKKKFPYDLEQLTWDNEHIRNMEDKYCYCGKGFKEDQSMIRCDKCRQWFHRDCIKCLEKPLLFGDTFAEFNCSVCTQGSESFHRKGLSWISIVHLVIYNLIKNAQIEDEKKPKKDRREHYYFRWKEDVCAFIDEHWDYLIPDKQRSATWNNTIASVLSTHSNIFLSGLEKFHQSAWWTLHKFEPPSSEKKSKSATRVKQSLKKSLKRSKVDSESSPRQKKQKKVKAEKKKDTSLDFLELSSLSELSDDSLSDVETYASDVKIKKESTPVDTSKLSLRETTSVEKPSKKTTNKPAAMNKKNKSLNELKTTGQERSPSIISISEPMEKSALSSPVSASKETSVVSVSEVTPKEKISSNAAQSTPKEPTPSVIIKPEINPSIISEESKTTSQDKTNKIPRPLNSNSTKHNHSSVPPLNSSSNPTLTQQEEWLLLQKLEHSTKQLSPAASRYKRKLAVRRLKRNLGIKLFDVDHHVVNLLRMPNHPLEPISKETVIQPASNQQVEQVNDDQQQLLDKITFTPYTSSFASRLYGSIRQRHTITRDEPWLSSWNGRKLRPFIRRDFQSKPRRMLLMGQIKSCNGKPITKGAKQPDGLIPGESIDYVYFQKEHLNQVNLLLSRSFWEGIDVSESLLFPEFSIVALYKRHVIGCAFMTPEAYITYFAVDPGWTNAGIGQFMLYHLFQTAISKDITLHVSANNNAMILYQKFGFKPEEFIVNFYDKYLPADSVFSKNAFFLRLRR